MKRKEIKLLVEQARAGNQQAYTALYKATSQTVYRTVHAMVRSEELTLDIQQDVYVHAFTHLDQLSDPEKFLPWIRTIAVNQTRTALRREQPILFSELEELSEADAADVPDRNPEISPELALDQKETSRLVHEILDGLTDAQRMLVGMYYYEQIPVKQIAEDLGVSQGSVKSQLFRSRKKVEAEVRRLEKKGVKLYGLFPLPFLLGLLKNERLEAEAGKKVLAAVVNEAVKPAALQVGRRFFETLAGKLVLGVLAAGVIGGGAAGWSWASRRISDNMGDVRPTEPSVEERMEYRDNAEDLPTQPVTTEPDTEPQNSAPVTTEPVIGTTFDAPEDLTTEPNLTATEQNENSAGASQRPSTNTEPAPSTSGHSEEQLPEYLGEYLYQYNSNSPVVWDYSFACSSEKKVRLNIQYPGTGPYYSSYCESSYANGTQYIHVSVGSVGIFEVFIENGSNLYLLATITVNAQLPADYPASPEDLIDKNADPQVVLWSWSPSYMETITEPFAGPGVSRTLYIVVKGNDVPALSFSHPEVLELNLSMSEAGFYNGSRPDLIEYAYTLTAVAPGSCTITCSYMGSQAFTVHVTVPEPVQDPEPTTEPVTEPVTEPFTEPETDPASEPPITEATGEP